MIEKHYFEIKDNFILELSCVSPDNDEKNKTYGVKLVDKVEFEEKGIESCTEIVCSKNRKGEARLGMDGRELLYKLAVESIEGYNETQIGSIIYGTNQQRSKRLSEIRGCFCQVEGLGREFDIIPKDSNRILKFGGKPYKESQIKTFTYSDFLDVFLAPINKVNIQGEQVIKTNIDAKGKIKLFFGIDVPPSTSDELCAIYNDILGYQGRNLDSSFAKRKMKLKALLCNSDLIQVDENEESGLAALFAAVHKAEEEQKEWENSNNIYTTEKYQNLQEEFFKSVNCFSEFISSRCILSTFQCENTSKRCNKIDELIVGLYFIALSNYKLENETYALIELRKIFVEDLKNKLRSLFEPDGNDRHKEFDEIVRNIQLLQSKNKISKEEGYDRIINFAIKLNVINENQLEQTHDVGPIKTK